MDVLLYFLLVRVMHKQSAPKSRITIRWRFSLQTRVSKESRSVNQLCPFESQRKSPFAIDFLFRHGLQNCE